MPLHRSPYQSHFFGPTASLLERLLPLFLQGDGRLVGVLVHEPQFREGDCQLPVEIFNGLKLIGVLLFEPPQLIASVLQLLLKGRDGLGRFQRGPIADGGLALIELRLLAGQVALPRVEIVVQRIERGARLANPRLQLRLFATERFDRLKRRL